MGGISSHPTAGVGRSERRWASGPEEGFVADLGGQGRAGCARVGAVAGGRVEVGAVASRVHSSIRCAWRDQAAGARSSRSSASCDTLRRGRRSQPASAAQSVCRSVKTSRALRRRRRRGSASAAARCDGSRCVRLRRATRRGASSAPEDLDLRDSALQIADDAFTSAGQSDYCGVAEIRVSVRFRRGAAAVNDVGPVPAADVGWTRRKSRRDRGSGLALEDLIPAGDAVSKRLFA